jgi:hypothetical protein
VTEDSIIQYKVIQFCIQPNADKYKTEDYGQLECDAATVNKQLLSFLLNVTDHSYSYVASHPRRLESSITPL